ncbi:MAG: Ferredoxin [Subtercola sp.]|nr:Ferredoxin [Subtercola sp.]
MRFAVDLDVCQNIGQCSFTAPDIFELDDDGKLAFRRQAAGVYDSPELSADDEELAEAAASLCPMQAIRMAG